MPKKVVNQPKPAVRKTTPAKATKTATGPTQSAEAKRAAQAKQDAALMVQVVKRAYKGDETVGAVAKDLSITAGKAAFLIMQHRVAVGEVDPIEAKTEASLFKAIASARAKADEFSSWGWLAARSGRSEAFIKSGLKELGIYEPKAENIAIKRSAAKPKATPKSKATPKPRTPVAGKKVRGNA